MFEGSRLNNIIPGYTGYIPKNENEEDILQMQKSKSRIPGYAGYISGVKSENLFGRTYGKTTFESSTRTIHRGVDLTPDLKYTSEAKGNYIDPKDFKKRDLAKKQEIENRQNVPQGIPISQIYKFFAYEDKYSQYKEEEPYEGAYCGKTQNLGNSGVDQGGNKGDERFSTKLSYEEASKIAHLG